MSPFTNPCLTLLIPVLKSRKTDRKMVREPVPSTSQNIPRTPLQWAQSSSSQSESSASSNKEKPNRAPIFKIPRRIPLKWATPTRQTTRPAVFDPRDYISFPPPNQDNNCLRVLTRKYDRPAITVYQVTNAKTPPPSPQIEEPRERTPPQVVVTPTTTVEIAEEKPESLETDQSIPLTYQLEFLDMANENEITKHYFRFEVKTFFERLKERSVRLNYLLGRRPDLMPVIVEQQYKGAKVEQLMLDAIKTYPKSTFKRGTDNYVKVFKEFAEKSELLHRYLKTLKPPVPFQITDAVDYQRAHICNCMPCSFVYTHHPFHYEQLKPTDEIGDYMTEISAIKRQIKDERPLRQAFVSYNRFNFSHARIKIHLEDYRVTRAKGNLDGLDLI